jgi:hypothetical protein
MPDLRITTVRFGPDKSREMLQKYIFGGKYTLPWVPRNIDPAFVSRFITEEVKPDAARAVYLKVLDVIRFYERSDVLAQLMLCLNRREAQVVELLRSLYAIQMAGDLGSDAQKQTAAAYLDNGVVAHGESEKVYGDIGQTLIVLAPAGSPEAFAKKVDAQIRERAPFQRDSEEKMNAYDRVADVKRNTIPAVNASIAEKKKLLAKKPPERVADLVKIYLGRSPLSSDYMRLWAARTMRFDVAQIGFAPHKAEFVKAVAAIPKPDLGQTGPDLILVRAVQAMLYFQDPPPLAQLEMYAAARGRPGIHLNFLYDDND